MLKDSAKHWDVFRYFISIEVFEQPQHTKKKKNRKCVPAKATVSKT